MATPDEVLLALPSAIYRGWGLSTGAITVADGGINSVTARVDAGGASVFAKWVPRSDAAALIGGARVAALMSDRGIRAGRPVLTRDGSISVRLLGGELVLLEEVVGEPLGRGDADLWDWGTALARIHADRTTLESGEFFTWLWELGAQPWREGWVRRAVDTVAREYDALPPLTWAQLHTDPDCAAFRRDPAGDVGVIDWTGSVRGPVLYDVASAAMYAGSEQAASRVIDGYRSAKVIPDTELREHLDTFRRFRAVVQAVYFSHRLREADLTGMTSDAENRQGLQDARDLLRAAGIAASDD